MHVMKPNVRDFRFTFGQYKGTHISKVPKSYLEWLEREKVAAGENTSAPIMLAIAAELKERAREGNK